MSHRILFAAYRDWALDVVPHVRKHPMVGDLKHITTTQEMVDEVAKHRELYDFVLMCGWSGQPPKSVIDSIPVFSEHPATSDLYSLGTPIQNQIQDGVKYTKHRLVKVGFPELVDRSYCHEVDISLAGGMDDITEQMKSTCRMLYDMFLDDYPNISWKQWDAISERAMRTPRVPADSRITSERFAKMTSTEMYDFCRMLEGPYPRAFFEDEFGTVFFEKVSYKAKK